MKILMPEAIFEVDNRKVERIEVLTLTLLFTPFKSKKSTKFKMDQKKKLRSPCQAHTLHNCDVIYYMSRIYNMHGPHGGMYTVFADTIFRKTERLGSHINIFMSKTITEENLGPKYTAA